jgi:hypothetical protein
MIHGSGFEFVRDDSMKRTRFRSPRTVPDGKAVAATGLNRNQFGGSFGGPIARDRLFLLSVPYQRTRGAARPDVLFPFVPTAAMLAGDFTAFAGPQCQAGRQMTLRAPVQQQSRGSVALLEGVSQTGQPVEMRSRATTVDRYSSTASTTTTSTSSRARSSYSSGSSHNIFARLQYQKYDSPTDYDGTDTDVLRYVGVQEPCVFARRWRHESS